jgi:bla regulator protein blaR1
VTVPTRVVEALGWALIHFLWQGAVLGLLFGAAAVLLRRASPHVRYLAGCATMLAMLAAPAGTFIAKYRAGAAPARIALAPAAAVTSGPAIEIAPPAASSSRTPPDFMPWLVMLWSVGVLAMSAWSAGGWLVAERRRRRSEPMDPAWPDRVRRLALRMGIERSVAVCRSALLETPAVIGWIKPVILVPACALTNLPPEQLEMILAHELAHIRRCDYLVNLLQTAAETLLFYHPAVWWVGRRIREEREHCADDLAVACCGDAVGYARALAELEQVRASVPAFAMAATGGSLLARVRRLLASHPTGPEPRSGWLFIAAILAISVLMCQVGRASRPVIAAQLTPPAAAARPPEPPDAAQAAPVAPPPPLAPLAPTLAPPRAAPPDAEAPPPPPPVFAKNGGFLEGLAATGYTNLSVDDIILLKQRGVTPEYMKAMREAGLGVPTPGQLVTLKDQNISPDYAKAAKDSGISDLTWERLPQLRNAGVNPATVQAIHALGFGPYTAAECVRLSQHGVSASFMQKLKNLGLVKASIDQIVKLRSSGL